MPHARAPPLPHTRASCSPTLPSAWSLARMTRPPDGPGPRNRPWLFLRPDKGKRARQLKRTKSYPYLLLVLRLRLSQPGGLNLPCISRRRLGRVGRRLRRLKASDGARLPGPVYLQWWLLDPPGRGRHCGRHGHSGGQSPAASSRRGPGRHRGGPSPGRAGIPVFSCRK